MPQKATAWEALMPLQPSIKQSICLSWTITAMKISRCTAGSGCHSFRASGWPGPRTVLRNQRTFAWNVPLIPVSAAFSVAAVREEELYTWSSVRRGTAGVRRCFQVILFARAESEITKDIHVQSRARQRIWLPRLRLRESERGPWPWPSNCGSGLEWARPGVPGHGCQPQRDGSGKQIGSYRRSGTL